MINRITVFTFLLALVVGTFLFLDEAPARAETCTCGGETENCGDPSTLGGMVICGTAGDDVLEGTPDGDRMCGFGGYDLLKGGRGADCLNGGSEDDELRGGWNSDVLEGGEGDFDVLKGGHCADHLDGGPGDNDTCQGGWGLDIFQPDSCEPEDQGKEVDHPRQGDCGCVGAECA
jgi:hypothetical protein